MKIIKRIYLFYLKRNNPIKWARKLGVEVGENCRLIDVSFSTEPYLVKIGNHVSATKVHFETHDGGVWIFRDKNPTWDIIKPISVGNNVYIGRDVIILPGITIGDNTIIGARSVVTKDVPNNYVVAGVPAKKIKLVDDYYEKVSNEIIETKLFDDLVKKNFLINKFLK